MTDAQLLEAIRILRARAEAEVAATGKLLAAGFSADFITESSNRASSAAGWLAGEALAIEAVGREHVAEGVE